jgi:predicted Zn-dependent peptidase
MKLSRAAAWVPGLVLLWWIAMGSAEAPPAHAAPAPPRWEVPVKVKQLANGLSVVVSEDHSAPTFGITVAYRVGFRLEPRGRTGFAHLFEHMMFEGTPNSPKGTFERVIEGGGGVNNGSTRYDYTDYIASAPISALEPILWLEADRMKELDLSQENLDNQRDVVKEEIRVNVKNSPYGSVMWTDIGTLAFDKWENGHDGYGSFTDLDSAAVADVRAFHQTFYAPSNAVLALAGDLTPEEGFSLAEKYFGAIPPQPAPPRTDYSESLNSSERTLTQSDPFANVPALVVAWKVPDPKSPDFLPLAVLGELLGSGDASRFYLQLVKGKGTVLQISGGLGWPLADYLSCNGPTLLNFFALYKPNTDAASVLRDMQGAADQIGKEGVSREELERTKTKMLADFYSQMEMMIDRADVLAIQQLITGDVTTINQVPGRLAAVTPGDIQRVAAKYLTVANRSSIDRLPAEGGEPGQGAQGGTGGGQ